MLPAELQVKGDILKNTPEKFPAAIRKELKTYLGQPNFTEEKATHSSVVCGTLFQVCIIPASNPFPYATFLASYDFVHRRASHMIFRIMCVLFSALQLHLRCSNATVSTTS